jgi:hypothetical protein
MSVKARRPKRLNVRITPELRSRIERLVELNAAHLAAIRGGDQSFYDDGRHEEMCEIGTEVRQALGIKPWDDEIEALQAALARS